MSEECKIPDDLLCHECGLRKCHPTAPYSLGCVSCHRREVNDLKKELQKLKDLTAVVTNHTNKFMR
jgi:hypothetical protein